MILKYESLAFIHLQKIEKNISKQQSKACLQILQVKLCIYKLFLSRAGKNFRKMSTVNSVIIIGAGLAGLTAADQILKAAPNTKVTIIQAMSAPGGRTRSIQLNGAKFDMGAQWVGPPQLFTQELGRRAGNKLMLQNPIGSKIIQLGNQLQAYTDNLPQNFGQAERVQLERVIKKIQQMAVTVPRDCPKNCPNAVQWDSMTAHSWIQLNIQNQKVKRFIQLIVRTNYGGQTNQVSFLFFLYYIHQNHGFATMMNTTGGLQAFKFEQGTQPLSFYLQKQIKKRGGEIHYNSFVNKINRKQNQVTVFTRNGVSYKAKYLIMATPPQAVKKIQFEPQLSRERRFINDRYVMAAFSKMVLLYDKRYWFEKGYSGEILSDCHDSPLLNAYDDTKPNAKGELQPAIIVLFAAGIQEEWCKDQQVMKRQTIEKLAKIYGCPEMRNPIKVEYKIWNYQQSLGGAPTAFTPPGALSKIQDMRKPQGQIHWAGTQTALVSQGYMDGAIESGYRVSKELLERFRKDAQQTKKEISIPVVNNYNHYHLSNKSMHPRL